MNVNNQIKELKEYFKADIESFNYKKDIYLESLKLKINNQFLLFILLPPKFAYEAPILFITPIIKHSNINDKGEINLKSIVDWSYKLNLLQTILKVIETFKYEMSINLNNQVNNVSPVKSNNNVNEAYNIMPSEVINHNSNFNENYNKSEINIKNIEYDPFYKEFLSEDNIKANLEQELKNKSLDQLILIYNNQDEFLEKLAYSSKLENITLIEEVSKLQNETNYLDSEIAKIQNTLSDKISQYQNFENQLIELESSKQKITDKYSNDGIIKNLNEMIDNKYSKERQALVSQLFANKSIENEEIFENFVREYKEVSKSYHIYSILRDKIKGSSVNNFKVNNNEGYFK